MLQREFRVSDLPRLIELQNQGFPEENALYGIQPLELEKFVRRLNRPHLRFLLGFARAIGRPMFRFPVIEEGGRVVATTMLTFSPRSGYVSMVMVDEASRRRGYARTLLDTARRLTQARRKPYVVLDVLADNTPALTLYEAIGYRRLRMSSAMVREGPFESLGASAASSAVRPHAKKDLSRLTEIAGANRPAQVAEVLPVRANDLAGGGWSSRMFATDYAAWVVDNGHGPEAFLSASITPVTVAAHFAPPVVSAQADPAQTQALVQTALTWAGEHRAPRVVVHIPEENETARRMLLAAGFRDALSLATLYRPAA